MSKLMNLAGALFLMVLPKSSSRFA